MFNLNLDNGTITIPQGDTAQFKIILESGRLPEGSVAVFGVCNTANPNINMFTKVFDVKENEIDIRLTNKEMRVLPIGIYRWDVRIVTDPERNEDGTVRADDPGDDVYSLFSGNTEMPNFIVTNTATVV